LNVSFAGEDDEEEKENQNENVGRGHQTEKTWSSMASLSAGQKTVVATAFIFGLQRCNPVSIFK